MAEVRPAPPHGRYKRGLEGADFTLESNTEAVPSDGRYYVMQAGEEILATTEFEEATAAYHKLCREFWAVRLESESPQVRVAAAWGLLGLDSTDKVAQGIILQDGTAQERKRLEQAQSRRRAMRPRPAPAAVEEKAEAPADDDDADEAEGE